MFLCSLVTGMYANTWNVGSNSLIFLKPTLHWKRQFFLDVAICWLNKQCTYFYSFFMWDIPLWRSYTRCKDNSHQAQQNSLSILYGFNATCTGSYASSHHQAHNTPNEKLLCKSHYVILHQPYILSISQLHKYCMSRLVWEKLNLKKTVLFPQRCDKHDKLKVVVLKDSNCK